MVRPGAVARALLLVTIFVAGEGACGGADSEPASEEGQHGDAPPLYTKPVPLVPGEYTSPAGIGSALEDAIAAQKADEQIQKFEGTINDVRALPPGKPGNRDACGGDDIAEFLDSTYLEFAYLPPGTAALGPQYAAVCPDGSVASYGQELIGLNYRLTIQYLVGEREFTHDASVNRVSAGEVAGGPGVIIAPVTPDGFGRSWIAYATTGGMVLVAASDLPLTESMKVTEGVKCAECR